METRVKVCCIQSPKEAETAVDCGASAVGLVASMPSGPGVIEEAAIASIARSVPPPIATFLLTSELVAERIAAQQRRCGTNTVQICDHVSPSVHRELRERIPGIGLVQVVHVESQASVDYALSVEGTADALLLDSGRPSTATSELGGTGRTHDWRLSRAIREGVRAPVFLAGGLHADNVSEAIRAVEPFGIDLCSGVRTAGRLDPEKLRAFFASVRDA